MTPWTSRQSSSSISRVSFQNSPPDIHEIAYSPVQSTPLNMSTDSSALNSILVRSSSNIRRPSVNNNKQLFAVVDDEDVGSSSNNNNNVDVNNIGRRRKSSSRSTRTNRKRKGTSSSSRRSSSSRSRSGVKEEEAQGYTLSGLVDGALTKITDVLFDNLGCDSACSGWMMDASTPSTCKIFTTQ